MRATPSNAMNRLSSPLADIEPHYDAVVIGSGYGGSIAACRLARAGRRVALLERGRELHPGEYPRTLAGAALHMQTTEGAHATGDPRSLYWFHLGAQMNVFSGCGLGGTSLVNANVSLRPDPRIFGDERWPAALRDDPAGLDRGYERAEAMLTPATYPDSFPPLAKVQALRGAAGPDEFGLAPINVTFRAGPNAAGVHQEACTGCGDCVSGCNYGAKNTVLMNYLPDAAAHGTQIFTEVDVRWIEPGSDQPKGSSWVVRAQPLRVGRDHADAPLRVSTDLVVLAAGTLGTARVLFHSRDHGLSVSDRLGQRFSGNGDVLAFAYRSDETVRGVGAGPTRPDRVHPAGPCITAVIDRRPGRPLEEGMLVADAVVPGAVAELLPIELLGEEAPEWLRGRLRRGGPLASLLSLVTGGRRGATQRLQTLLVMGNDDDQGTLVADGDAVRIDWPGAGTSPYYERANRAAAEIAARGGGTFLEDPLASGVLRHDLITVHPLGGCVMADRAEDGVVDHRGRVFGGPVGETVHDGLVVWDGSIVPRPLGVNPLLTISALAERAVAALIAEKGWTVDESPMPAPPGPPGPAGPRGRPGLLFSTRMLGHWSAAREPETGDVAPYEEAEAAGEADGSTLALELTLSTDDLAAEEADPALPMTVVGTVGAPGLSDEPLVVEGGSFQLVATGNAVAPGVRPAWYRLPLRAADGRRFFLTGFTRRGPGDRGDPWAAPATLYLSLRVGGPDGVLVGRGVTRVSPVDFVRQLDGVTVTGPAGERERLELEMRFGRSLAGALYDQFGSVVHRPTRFNPAPPLRRRRPLDLPMPEVHEYRTGDGVPLRLTRYTGGRRGPVLLVHGMGANPLTFLLDTVETNLAEYLVGHGVDVWVQEWRGSTGLAGPESAYTADTVARFDHPAVQAAVREHSGRADLHVVAHCAGSLTWVMATLAGVTAPTSLFCSSVAAHPVTPPMTRLKVGLHLGELMRRLGVGTRTWDESAGLTRRARLAEVALRGYPVPESERCDQTICRRLAFMYGVPVHHANMNEAAHATLHELFGTTDMTMMCHLSTMARAERLVSAWGADEYLPHLERLHRPVTLLSGTENLVWTPESTERDYQELTQAFGDRDVQRILVEGYGHNDVLIGATAARDTFPAILDHLDRVNA